MYRPTAQPRICSLAVRMGDEGKAVGSSHIRPTALLCGHFAFPLTTVAASGFNQRPGRMYAGRGFNFPPCRITSTLC